MTPEFDAPEGGYFEHWMEALDELDQALPARAQPACPNCGRRELRAQYIGDPEDRVGYGAIWCDRDWLHGQSPAVPVGGWSLGCAVTVCYGMRT